MRNTHESINGAKCFVRNALGKLPVFHRSESFPPWLSRGGKQYGEITLDTEIAITLDFT